MHSALDGIEPIPLPARFRHEADLVPLFPASPRSEYGSDWDVEDATGKGRVRADRSTSTTQMYGKGQQEDIPI